MSSKAILNLTPLGLISNQEILPSNIIFGCTMLNETWGNLSKKIRDEAVHSALSNGIYEFDTAPLYGNSEDNLGEAIYNSKLGYKAIFITKCGKVIRNISRMNDIALVPPTPFKPFSIPNDQRVLVPNYTFNGAELSHKESIERMSIVQNKPISIHTLRMHDPDSVENGIENAIKNNDGLIDGMVHLRKIGKIKCVSIGMNANVDHTIITKNSGGLTTTKWTPDVIINILKSKPIGTFDNILLAYSFNLFRQDGYEVMQECHRRGISVHVAGVWSGLYHINAGSGRQNVKWKEAQKKMNKWRELAQKYGKTVESVAIGFAFAPSIVSKVVLGMKSKDEVEQNLKAASDSKTIPMELWKEAKDLGLYDKNIQF